MAFPDFKLGKKPARPDAYSFKLTKFLSEANKIQLPTAPPVFGHQGIIRSYGMLANDRYGDCVWAGAAHETMLWTSEAGSAIAFSDRAVLSDYSAVTGFTPSNPDTDQGTDMEAAAKYRRKTGILDAQGKRHTIDAYLELPGVSARGRNDGPTLLASLASCAYVFGAVGLGVEFPSTAMAQFDSGKPWDEIPGASIEGGHYVPLVGRVANGNFLVITWGQLQEVTPAFVAAYADEAVVYISIEQLKGGKNDYGFDLAALRSALAGLGGSSPTPGPVPVPTPVPVTDPNVVLLDKWAATKHVGATAKAAAAWKAVKAAHNL